MLQEIAYHRVITCGNSVNQWRSRGSSAPALSDGLSKEYNWRRFRKSCSLSRSAKCWQGLLSPMRCEYHSYILTFSNLRDIFRQALQCQYHLYCNDYIRVQNWRPHFHPCDYSSVVVGNIVKLLRTGIVYCRGWRYFVEYDHPSETTGHFTIQNGCPCDSNVYH